jgi:hypothetical protein
MTYLLLALSVLLNGMLVWYVRKMLGKLQYEVEVRDAFTQMLEDYSQSLQNLYKLEELYGEEIIKRAINETNFVIEACQEFKKAIEIGQGSAQEGQEDDIEVDPEDDEVSEGTPKESVIRLREGQSISQDAASYRRVRPADFAS